MSNVASGKARQVSVQEVKPILIQVFIGSFIAVDKTKLRYKKPVQSETRTQLKPKIKIQK